MADGIYSSDGVYIDANEIETVHNTIEEITNNLISSLTSDFVRLHNNTFVHEGKSLDQYLLMFKSVNMALNGGMLIQSEPNLFGAIFSLSTYYELIQGFADFALEEYQNNESIFADKLKEFDSAKEALYD